MTNPVSLEVCQALRDVQQAVNLYGKSITVYLRGESAVTRDKYNSVSKSDISVNTFHSFKVFPFTTNPTSKEIEKAGIKERVEALCYLAMKDLTDNQLTADSFDLLRATVITDGITYLIKTLNLSSPFLDTYLYVVLGLQLK